jgi:hypothetical protein
MSQYQTHIEKYRMFKVDAEKETVSAPLRIEAYFSAIFHLIEASASKYNIHIDKHQNVRELLERNLEIFRNDTEVVWRIF